MQNITVFRSADQSVQASLPYSYHRNSVRRKKHIPSKFSSAALFQGKKRTFPETLFSFPQTCTSSPFRNTPKWLSCFQTELLSYHFSYRTDPLPGAWLPERKVFPALLFLHGETVSPDAPTKDTGSRHVPSHLLCLIEFRTANDNTQQLPAFSLQPCPIAGCDRTVFSSSCLCCVHLSGTVIPPSPHSPQGKTYLRLQHLPVFRLNARTLLHSLLRFISPGQELIAFRFRAESEEEFEKMPLTHHSHPAQSDPP